VPATAAAGAAAALAAGPRRQVTEYPVIVEDMERRQANVSDFILTQGNLAPTLLLQGLLKSFSNAHDRSFP
jgi:hypothetical protein